MLCFSIEFIIFFKKKHQIFETIFLGHHTQPEQPETCTKSSYALWRLNGARFVAICKSMEM